MARTSKTASRKAGAERCFCCGRKFSSDRRGLSQRADTRDGQIVDVGFTCYEKILNAGDEGYQPPLGGPRLYPVKISAESAQ